MDDLYFYESIDQIQATAEPTRWQILNLLIAQPMTGSQLARALGIPRPLAHYHLKILEKVGLVKFQEERLRGGVVEKYFRAIARQFRTDHLVDQYRMGEAEKSNGLNTQEAVREMVVTMVEVAKADLANADPRHPLTRAPFNYQADLYLSQKQTQKLIQSLRHLSEEYVQHDKENRPLVDAEQAEDDCAHLRLTLLITPVPNLQFETIPPDTGQTKSGIVKPNR